MIPATIINRIYKQDSIPIANDPSQNMYGLDGIQVQDLSQANYGQSSNPNIKKHNSYYNTYYLG